MSANPIEIASILDRFRREHPGGDIEALRAWAVTQEGLRENPDLIERLVQALRDEAVFKGLMPRRDSPSEERSLYTRPGHEPRAVSADSSHTGPHTGRRIGRFVLQELPLPFIQPHEALSHPLTKLLAHGGRPNAS